MNFSQLSFDWFSFEIYGLFVTLAFTISAWRYYKALQKKQFPIHFFIHHFWKWMLGGVVAGRLFALLFDWNTIVERSGIYSFFAFWDGDIHFIGALTGFILTMIWDMRKQSMDSWRWIDIGIPFIFMGMLITDLGGFLTGAVYGKETSMLWGIQYENVSVDILTPVHPVTIYAFIIHLWLYFWAQKRKDIWSNVPGRLAIRMGLLFFSVEFFLQFFRGDPTLIFFDSLRIDQLLSLLFVILLFWWGRKRSLAKT